MLKLALLFSSYKIKPQTLNLYTYLFFYWPDINSI